VTGLASIASPVRAATARADADAAPRAGGRGFLPPDARMAERARRGDTRELAVEAARTLVSEAFIKPIFAQLREGNLASEAFKPGVAERRFRPLLDAALADAVVAKSGFGIVEVAADRFERALNRGGDAFVPSARPSARTPDA